MAALGSKPITAHDDTREFIRGLEMTARKVWYSFSKPFKYTYWGLLPLRPPHTYPNRYIATHNQHARTHARRFSPMRTKNECKNSNASRAWREGLAPILRPIPRRSLWSRYIHGSIIFVVLSCFSRIARCVSFCRYRSTRGDGEDVRLPEVKLVLHNATNTDVVYAFCIGLRTEAQYDSPPPAFH